MKRLITILLALVAVALMAGTSFAGGINHGSWQEFTALNFGTNYLAGTNETSRINRTEGPNTVVVLNYETGQVNYVRVGNHAGMTVPMKTSEEYYGVAPAWSEHKGMTGTTVMNYKEGTEMTPEMDLYLY